MKMFKIFTISSIITLFSLSLYLGLKEKKVAYIDNNKIFIEFGLTKEIDAELKKIEVGKQHVLDSLLEVIKKIDAGVIKINEKEYDFLRKQYAVKSNKFSQEISTMKQASIEKIWKQINQYISDFSKENDYFMVFGANGQGTLMYANESIDITKEVSEYINGKFNGKK
jgi:outer membrane protein